MQSMTGYGRGIAEKDGLSITVELKSVNNRYLDISCKLPRQFIFLEDGLRKGLAAKLNRGSINVFVNFEDKRELVKDSFINMSLAKSYADAAKKLSNNFSLENDFTVSNLIRMPEVVTFSDNEDDKLFSALLNEALNSALKELIKMREAEGNELIKDILKRLEIILEHIKTIKERAPKLAKEFQEKLVLRISDFLKDVAYDEAKLLNEVAYYTDKSNIDEELTRLTSHVLQFKKMCKATEPMGRKMDFIIQEFNREANTICSKSNDLVITNAGLDLKSEIEKIREQVQNLE